MKATAMIAGAQTVAIALFATWVLLTLLAELVHSCRLRSAKTAINRYTVGYILSIIVLLLRASIFQPGSGTPLPFVIFAILIDSLSFYVFGVYTLLRGVFLVLSLFGKGTRYETRYAELNRAPRHICLPLAYFLAAVFVVRAGSLLVGWVLIRVLI
jgi:hypothetical protein